MEVLIKRIDKTLPLPVYETKGSVGFDLLARKKTIIKKKEIALIPANIIVKTPEKYALIIVSRSSTPRKKRITMPHGLGIIDQDYSGEKDEIKIQVLNFSETDTIIEKGEKIAQGIFIRTDIANFTEVAEMSQNSRGGFGSTDK